MNFKKYIPNKRNKKILIKLLDTIKGNTKLIEEIFKNEKEYFEEFLETVENNFQDCIEEDKEYFFEILNIVVCNVVYTEEEDIENIFTEEEFNSLEKYYNKSLYKLFEYFNN